ncbi:MAG: 50S ribosomal protein L30 [Fimbriimonadaceae bacterium]|nr:50S ribosomal protein L30 [Fimbriimonadaceae bacterium]
MSQLKITLVRSPAGRQEVQKRTVKALGLRRLHQQVVHEDNPTIRGMVGAVQHLLRVEELA